jgi:hypothetical protein
MPAHAFKPTDEQRKSVDAMAACGVPEKVIARVLGIAPMTLRKHFKEELALGHVKANTAVAQFLFWKATHDGPQAVTAAIFWAKTRMGWRERDFVSDPALVPHKILGKKEQALVDAREPDPGTSLGELMARRQHESLN